MAKTHFIWDELSDNVLMETDELGAVQAEYTQEPGLYGSVVSQKRDDDTSYYHFDGQGSTRALTDSDQNVTDTATYTAFGEDVEKTGATENPWGYKGALGYYENPGGDLYVRARTLSPTLGRWLSADPLGFVDLYVYVGSDPINNSDPSGLVACKPTSKASGGVGYVPRGKIVGIPTQGLVIKKGLMSAMEIEFRYYWNENEFGTPDCCCCDKIGWAQIVQENVDYKGLLPTIGDIVGWIIPGVPKAQPWGNWEIDTAIPYPGGYTNEPKTADPCNAKWRKPMGRLLSYDRPGIAPKLVGSQLLRRKFLAQMCVYCMEGVEGPFKEVIWPGVNAPAITFTYLTMYGCISWGFDMVFNEKAGTYEVDYEPVTSKPPQSEDWRHALNQRFF